MNTDPPLPKKPHSLGGWIFRVLAGYELAVICLLLLLVATFFGTLEQEEVGLYRALRKYFDMHVLYVLPTINGKTVPLPLPGVFWVSALLFVNLTLGGLGRARKGWKTIGVLISHFGILFLLVAGAVSHLHKREGVMQVYQGDRSDYARSYTEPSIEVYPYENGARMKPYVVPSEAFRGLQPDDTLTVRLPELPFDLEVTGFLRSSDLLEYDRSKDQFDSEPVVDGFFLKERPRAKSEESNLSGAYVTLRDKEGEEIRKLVLHYPGPIEMAFPVTATVDGERYGFSMVREIWPMPFQVELRKTMGEYYPGTQDPSWFQSDITKVDGELETDYSIVMNKPMRHGGITLYQANWAPPMQGGRPRSGFAIVENPSDQWPKYALYVATLGLLIHFGMKLFGFLGASRQKSPGRAMPSEREEAPDKKKTPEREKSHVHEVS